MRNALQCCAVVALSALPICAQAPAATPPAGDHVAELVGWADTLRMEFRADIQLHAVESGGLRGKEAEEVLQRLFRDAGSAHQAYKQKDVTQRSDTRERKRATAFSLNLDTLSIRTRVVRAMLRIHPARARTLFEGIRLDVPSAPCESAMVYDVSDYYEVLAAVLAASADADAADATGPQALLEARVRDIHSPVQLAPLAALLARAALAPDELEWFTALFAQGLERVQATDRELGAIQEPLGNAVRLLAMRNAGQGLPVTSLLRAYRNFLVRTARRSRCADLGADREMIVSSFHQLREDLALAQDVPAVQAAELQPEESGGAARMAIVETRQEFLPLLNRLMARRQAALRAPAADAELEAAGWESDVEEMLTRAAALDGSRAECPACVFHEKADLYFIFFDFTPPGRLKERVLSELVRFLAADPMQDEAPLEWLFRVKLLLNLSRPPSEEQLRRFHELERQGKLLTMLPSAAGERIREALKQSGNYTLYLYVLAEEILPAEFIAPPY